ncbi:MAG: rhodanese-like domain-containing protein [Marinilabiliaceae bacterium]|nr:rhodanese-like domain-containing protein [Marinilabiliaceae bacterium]
MNIQALKQYQIKGILTVLILVLLSGICFEGIAQKKKVQRLEPVAFYEVLARQSNAMIIDTRPAYKFEEYRMKDAVLAVSQKDLLKVVKNQPKNRPLFVYCEFGDRSKRAIKVLAGKGFTTIYELKGGLEEWMEQGLEIDSTILK